MTDLKNFWQKLQSGVEIAVAGTSPDTLLGVRDAFLRFFHEGLDRRVSVAVVPHAIDGGPPIGLPVSDEETLRLARQRVLDIQEQLGSLYHFYIANEGGLHSIELDGRVCYFVRNWSVLRSPLGETWGSSGSVQLPERLVSGLDSEQVSFAVPGTRKSGGMVHSLTNGLETRRRAISVSTLHALSSLFYGTFERRRQR
jgi:non-canonical (house-cleaning) NTP pyrophosphatase